MVMFEKGRISQRLASPPPPKVEVSQTPKPMKPLGNSVAATPKSPEEHSVDPEFVEACLLDDDEWEDLPCPRPCFLPKLRKALQEPGDIAATHRCFDIFVPPPGDSDVISQVERLSSNETKIAPRLVWIAFGSSRWCSSDIGYLQVAWICNQSVAGTGRYPRRMGST
jgi:hypothetical protein